MEDDRLRGLVIVLATSSVFGFSFQVLVPVLARQVLDQGAEGFGLMLSATGVGALSGALGLALFGKRAAKGKIVSIASVTFGLCLGLLGMVRVFPVVLGILCLVGFTMINQTATTNTLLQTLAPDHLRGRIVSIYTLAFIGLMPFGSLLAGSLSDRWGPGPVLVGGGLVTATVALTALRRTPELWSVP